MATFSEDVRPARRPTLSPINSLMQPPPTLLHAADPRVPLTPLVVVHGTGGDAAETLAALRPHAERETAAPLVLLAPAFETPYQFLLPDADELLIARLDVLAAEVGRPVRRRALLYGMSGGAQFAHRFAQRHPDRVSACAALAAGAWTSPGGELFGMMSDEGWFERAEWSDPRVAAAGRMPANQGWDRVRWLIGCGTRDNASRVSSARRFHDVLVTGGAAATWVDWDGGHDGVPGDILDTVVRFFNSATA